MLNNKKKNAFTITELVIVIAVIAILAAVLIPTFSNVIEKANESAALQEARNAMTNYTLRDDYKGESLEGLVMKSGSFYFFYTAGELEKVTVTGSNEFTYTTSTGDVTYTITAIQVGDSPVALVIDGVDFFKASPKAGA